MRKTLKIKGTVLDSVENEGFSGNCLTRTYTPSIYHKVSERDPQ